jgi:superfamily II DNA or RNA helicase
VNALALETSGRSLPLRPYQRQALSAIAAAEARGVRRQLVVLPTGSGKTVVFSQLVSDRPGRALVLAHRDELIAQAAEKISMVGGSLDIGIVKAARNETDARVVVASVQSLVQPERLARLGKISTVIVDEAHHAVADTYMTILKGLGCFRDDGPLTVGFTATAGRGDKVGLGAAWQEITYQRGIIQMIAEGFLCDVRAMEIGSDFDLDNVQVRAGDYTDASLGEELERSDALGSAVMAYKQYAADRQGVAFTPTIATAHALAGMLTAQGIPSEAVDGKMHIDQRRAILRRLHNGDVQVVPNAQVLCLDDQTEILTESGWTGIDEMTMQHRVANWDQGCTWFAEPLEVVRRPRGETEDMFTLETGSRSIRVTRGHRMLYRTRRIGPYLKAPVQDLAGRVLALPTTGWAPPSDVAPDDSPELAPERRKHIVSQAAYNLRTRESFDWDESFIEAERRVERKYGMRYRAPSKLTPAEAGLIGFWIGDGGRVQLNSGGVEYRLSQVTGYPEIIRWIDATLEATGLDYIRRDKSHYPVPHVAWSLPRGTGGGSQQRNGVYEIEPYLDKDGSSLLWGLDDSQFEALLTGFWYADGSHGLASTGRPVSFSMTNTNRGLLDLLQAVASVRGWTSRIRRETAPRKAHHRQLWGITFNRRQEHLIGGVNPANRIHQETIPWRAERVWCVKTEARNIITRRRGTVTVMGNTEGWDEPAVSCALMLRPTKSAPSFVQMAGRVLRPFIGTVGGKSYVKEDALILDVVSSARFGLCTIADLAGLPPGSVKPGKSLLEADEERAAVEERRVAVAAIRAKTVELLRRSDLRWLEAEGGWVLPAGSDQVMLLVPAGDEQWHVFRSVKGRGPVLESGKPLALDWARGVGEEVARAHGGVLAQAHANWRSRPPSEAQVGALTRMGYGDKLPGITRGGAADLMTAHYAAKDIRRLRKAAA